jgi:NADPH:quinone reductase-like Zn-dependent oxidoreductase
LIRDEHIAKIPDNLTFEETATLGVGITTIGQTLYMTLKLPLPGDKPVDGQAFVLIYGGSSATGTLAIQFAKLYELLTSQKYYRLIGT